MGKLHTKNEGPKSRDCGGHCGLKRCCKNWKQIIGKFHTINEGPKSRDKKVIGPKRVSRVYWIMGKLHIKNEGPFSRD